jgi:acyl-CoA dehydrogenase
MIDFELTANDRKLVDGLRAQALVARGYARFYDENEHEFPPDALEEAKDFPTLGDLLEGRGDEDTPFGVISMLIMAGQTWGDYSVRMRRPPGGLGNAALRAAGTPEQFAKWQNLTLAMAITEPGCGSDPSRVQMTAVRDGDEWVLNGEKIFVTTGCRADGVIVWATIDKSAGRAGIKSFLVEKDTPGFVVTHKEKKLGIRADDTAAYVFTDCRVPFENLLGLDETIAKKSSGGFRGVMKTGARLHARPAAGRGRRDRVRAGNPRAVRRHRQVHPHGGALRGMPADDLARGVALRRGATQQHGGLGLQGQGGRRRARDHPGLHRDPGADGHLARAPAGEVVPRRAHHRHLRGHR